MNKKTTQTSREVIVDRIAIDTQILTVEEEQVIRMRHGIGVAADHTLELRGQRHPETRAKLAMIENLALEQISGAQPLDRRAKIIAALKSL